MRALLLTSAFLFAMTTPSLADVQTDIDGYTDNCYSTYGGEFSEWDPADCTGTAFDDYLDGLGYRVSGTPDSNGFFRYRLIDRSTSEITYYYVTGDAVAAARGDADAITGVVTSNLSTINEEVEPTVWGDWVYSGDTATRTGTRDVWRVVTSAVDGTVTSRVNIRQETLSESKARTWSSNVENLQVSEVETELNADTLQITVTTTWDIVERYEDGPLEVRSTQSRRNVSVRTEDKPTVTIGEDGVDVATHEETYNDDGTITVHRTVLDVREEVVCTPWEDDTDETQTRTCDTVRVTRYIVTD